MRGLGVWGSGFGVCDLGLGVWNLGLIVWRSGFRCWGVGFTGGPAREVGGLEGQHLLLAVSRSTFSVECSRCRVRGEGRGARDSGCRGVGMQVVGYRGIGV